MARNLKEKRISTGLSDTTRSIQKRSTVVFFGRRVRAPRYGSAALLSVPVDLGRDWGNAIRYLGRLSRIDPFLLEMSEYQPPIDKILPDLQVILVNFYATVDNTHVSKWATRYNLRPLCTRELLGVGELSPNLSWEFDTVCARITTLDKCSFKQYKGWDGSLTVAWSQPGRTAYVRPHDIRYSSEYWFAFTHESV